MGGFAAGLPKITGGGGASQPVINLNDEVKSSFNEVTSVAPGIQTTVLTYVGTSAITELMNVEFGGSNIAKFTLTINGVSKAQHYTYFGSGLCGTWDFRALDNGLMIGQGDILRISVLHGRPDPGDFFGRFNLLLITQ